MFVSKRIKCFLTACKYNTSEQIAMGKNDCFYCTKQDGITIDLDSEGKNFTCIDFVSGKKPTYKKIKRNKRKCFSTQDESRCSILEGGYDEPTPDEWERSGLL